MWKLNKPDVKTAKEKDVEKLVQIKKFNNCDSIKKYLKELYENYDTQNGYVSNKQLEDIQEDEAQLIYKAYDLTYKDKQLNYIRAELCEKVLLCPYCGINQVDTLDYYMPKSTYKVLAVCRMNLIPMCPTCNTLKGKKHILILYTVITKNSLVKSSF